MDKKYTSFLQEHELPDAVVTTERAALEPNDRIAEVTRAPNNNANSNSSPSRRGEGVHGDNVLYYPSVNNQ